GCARAEVARALDYDPGAPGAGGGNKGLPRELGRRKQRVDRGLTATASLGPPLRTAFGWVHRAAHLPGNEGTEDAGKGKRRWGGFVGAMARPGAGVGKWRAAVGHFRNVPRGYWPGLFFCDAVADLPRTNNDLEQLFGSHRSRERRARGRKGASPALVLRGAARL